MTCEGLDPPASTDGSRLADAAIAWIDYLYHCEQQGLYFIQPGRFVLPGDMAGAPALRLFPWPDAGTRGGLKLAQADKHTNAGMLREHFNYYYERVVKGLYRNHPLCSDRQIVLVDYLQPLSSGLQAPGDMCLVLTQLMRSSHYGQRTLFRCLFSPVIDKLLSVAAKAGHMTIDQYANMVSLLQQLIQDTWQNTALEGTSMDCPGLTSAQATASRITDVSGEKILVSRSGRFNDGASLTIYPDEVPARLSGQAFWNKRGFQFEAFRPQVMDVDKLSSRIRLNAALEFLAGSKL